MKIKMKMKIKMEMPQGGSLVERTYRSVVNSALASSLAATRTEMPYRRCGRRSRVPGNDRAGCTYDRSISIDRRGACHDLPSIAGDRLTLSSPLIDYPWPRAGRGQS
ncbi:hypothetical protein ALC53_06504 [Atta colombica]|uniref:Uncharacterized protein n=1 Tax=Atta colombica TaxID=520822 RepID=A0A195BF77_9HYME|nr:hypothetical protein ALC53_06504 [Atta colombica]